MNGALVGAGSHIPQLQGCIKVPGYTQGSKEEEKESVCVCVCICFVYWTDKWVVEHMLSSVLQQMNEEIIVVMGHCCNGSCWILFSQSLVPCQPGYKNKLATKLNVSCRFPTSTPPLSTSVTHQGLTNGN
jgi:hypothetical protein